MQGPNSSAARSTRGNPDSSSGSPAYGSLSGSSGLLYRPIRELGAGGMARVYLAYAHGTSGFSKLVVLKVMHQRLEESFRGMFLEEARLSARLNHPNLVQVYEVVDTGDVPYMVMEYLEGKPLSTFHTAGVLTEALAITVVCEALIGLHHAHELRDFDGRTLNLVHRDVSPHNVFVTYDGVVKMLDFGIAKTDAGAGHTQAGEVKGKLAYMAPEQLFGDRLDRRADIFAMGVILWEAIVGAPLWENVAQPQLMHRLAMGSIPRPSERATIDPDLEKIIVRATAAEPEQRYSDALEMHRALEQYCARKGHACSPRQVGATLATTYAHDRLEDQRVVREALRESLGPPPAPPVTPDEASVEIVAVREEPRSGGIFRWLALVVAAFLAGLGALTLFADKAPSRAVTPAPALAPVAPASVRLGLHATPADATIELDGVVRGTGSLELDVPADSRDHRLSIQAPGHATATRTLKFDRNQDLTIVLEADAAATPSSVKDAGIKAAAPAGRALPRATPAARAATSKAPEPQRPPGAASPEPPPSPANNCDPPYYFKGGIKTYRPECL